MKPNAIREYTISTLKYKISVEPVGNPDYHFYKATSEQYPKFIAHADSIDGAKDCFIDLIKKNENS